MDMSKFIEQHAEAAGVVGQIESLMAGGAIAEAQEVRSLLSALVGKLKLHLAVEDRMIYPEAKKSENTELREMSERLEIEMSGLAQALKDYSGKWSAADKINEDQAGFILETKGVFDALKNRIAVEEGTFYPLVAENL